MDSEYVSHAAWVAPAGRPDVIDEVADAVEKPDDPDAFWSEIVAGWPARPRPWAGGGFGTERRAG